jgi:hypothetical protein
MLLSSRFRSLCIAAVAVVFARPAAADIMQPDGTIVPVISFPMAACHQGQNVGACLDDNEVALGGMAGAIDAIHSATIDKETFNAQCQLTFKVISYGTSILSHAFGWYVARSDDTPPALSDLHVFLDCDETKTVGLTKTLTLPPGTGAIAFFTASDLFCPQAGPDGTLADEPTYTMYTQRRFNGRLRNGDPDPQSEPNFVRVLTYQSVAQPSSFYFAWEDDGGPGSDQNFEDLVTWVSGIECSSGGQPCDTGLKGFCAAGTMQCRGGVLTCVGDRTPVPEKCNGIDDNCDGNIDEGNPCDPGFVCFRGNCVPNCARGEFSCSGDTGCEADAGVCIDLGCFGVTCPAGQVCRAGACVGECVGVKCPYGQACRSGGCVDVCATQACDMGFVCVPTYTSGPDKDPVGLCANCGCQGCSAGTTCTAQHCVPNDCAAVTCSAGTHCVSGSCIDDCTGAVCPTGQKCIAGQCAPDPAAPKDAGSEAAVTPPILTTTTTGGAVAGTTSTTSGSGTGTGTGGAGGSDAPTRGPVGNSGCGCRVPGRPVGEGMAVSFLLAIAALARRRRKLASVCTR